MCFYCHLVNYITSILNLNDVSYSAVLVTPRFVFCYDDEGDSKTDIANVAEKMVEICQPTSWKGTFEVVITNIKISSGLCIILIL